MKVLIISDAPPLPFRPCIRKGHKWQALCKCSAARVCERCGIGEGTIPCEKCMVCV
jgi:hypothetical protein